MKKNHSYEKNIVRLIALLAGITLSPFVLQAMDIFEAANKGDIEKVQELINRGDRQDEDGNTALILAAAGGYLDVVNKLLKAGANKDIRDNLGVTALMFATFKGDLAIVDALLEAGANPNVSDNHGDTALTIALGNGLFDIAEKILENQAKHGKFPQKSCFLTFTQDDCYGSMVDGLIQALSSKANSIVSAYILHKLITRYPFFASYFQSGKWSFFLNETHTLGVIIPAAQEPGSGELLKKYGFKNLTYIQPQDVSDAMKSLNVIKPENQLILIDQFKSIIDLQVTEHPTRVYLAGHGTDTKIADIPLQNMEELLKALDDIDTQFLYIMSCCAAGQNLIEMQNKIHAIEFEREKKIDYIIAVQATSDIATYGVGNIGKFFEKLNEFLSPGQRGHRVSIGEVLKSLELKHFAALPVVRFPGTMTFFRSADLGQMEVITWSKLRALRFEKPMKIVQLKARLKGLLSGGDEKEISDQISQIEQEINTGQNTIEINPEIKYVQIFPCNLSDICFEIQHSGMPKFISKIPGQAQHLIGKITYKSQKISVAEALDDFIKRGFTNIFPGCSFKCWFIRSLELTVNNNVFYIDKLAVKVAPGSAHLLMPAVYHDSNGYHYKTDEVDSPIDEQEFKAAIKRWFADYKASEPALYEATGGKENYADVQSCVTRAWSL